MHKIECLSEAELKRFAKLVAFHLAGGEVLLLSGPIGSGKTTFVKGMASELGIEPSQIHSPSFALMNTYIGKKFVVYHVDLYRIDEPDMNLLMELEEILEDDKSVVIVEWPERSASFWGDFLEVHLEYCSYSERKLFIRARGDRYQRVVSEVIRRWHH